MTQKTLKITKIGMKALTHLYKNQTRILYPSRIAFETKTTYSHINEKIKELKVAGFVRFISGKRAVDRRTRRIELTKKGIELCELLLKINDMGVTL